jgi:hypothetical protein
MVAVQGPYAAHPLYIHTYIQSKPIVSLVLVISFAKKIRIL